MEVVQFRLCKELIVICRSFDQIGALKIFSLDVTPCFSVSPTVQNAFPCLRRRSPAACLIISCPTCSAMSTSNDKPLPTAGEAAPAPVSIPIDSLSEVNDQLETVKLSDQDEADAAVGDQDEARPPTDAAVGDTDTKEDSELLKPHPPTEECPGCLVPLPLENTKRMYWVCCGKMLCRACGEEHARALRVTNMKREKKKQPPLEHTCAFCRIPLHKNGADLLRRYEERIAKDDTLAMVNLARHFRDGSNGLEMNDEKALELFNRAAGRGSADAIGMLGVLAEDGWLGSIPNINGCTKAKEYFEAAVKKGDILSRYHLALISAQEGNIDLAIKHSRLAAAAGCDDAMKCLWECFSKSTLSKPDLEKALRAHKAASDEMNSEERERFAAAKEATAGNDKLLEDIYTLYYGGYLNAKELKVVLKHHRAGNLRAVEMMLLRNEANIMNR